MPKRPNIVESPAVPPIQSEIRIFKEMYFDGSAWGANYFLEGDNTSPSGRTSPVALPSREPYLADYGFPY